MELFLVNYYSGCSPWLQRVDTSRSACQNVHLKNTYLHTRFARAAQAGALLFGTTQAMQDSGGCARR